MQALQGSHLTKRAELSLRKGRRHLRGHQAPADIQAGSRSKTRADHAVHDISQPEISGSQESTKMAYIEPE